MLELAFAATSIGTLIVLVVTGGLIWHQMKISQLQASRVMQMELIKLALEHPEMRETFVGQRNIPDQGEYEVSVYRNLWLMHLQMNYVIGTETAAETRQVVRDQIFSNQHGVDWWTMRRSSRWRVNAGRSRRKRKFVEIVESAHSEVTAETAAVVS